MATGDHPYHPGLSGEISDFTKGIVRETNPGLAGELWGTSPLEAAQIPDKQRQLNAMLLTRLGSTIGKHIKWDEVGLASAKLETMGVTPETINRVIKKPIGNPIHIYDKVEYR